jgi:hypothetical protein
LFDLFLFFLLSFLLWFYLCCSCLSFLKEKELDTQEKMDMRGSRFSVEKKERNSSPFGHYLLMPLSLSRLGQRNKSFSTFDADEAWIKDEEGGETWWQNHSFRDETKNKITETKID